MHVGQQAPIFPWSINYTRPINNSDIAQEWPNWCKCYHSITRPL
jgi:hypothetical protein